MLDPNNNPTLKDLLHGDRFIYGAELVTTRGMPEPDQPSKLTDLGEALADDSRISWVSITDNPGGNPMIPADWVANVLKPRGKELVIHLTTKDLNRNGLESAAWRYAAEGFNNILALTGDFPTAGYRGLAQPVFDLDSTSLIAMMRAMNEGLENTKPNGKKETLTKTNFNIGCAVSPFKRQERELMPQYFKLARKIQNGAEWIVPQLGYDMRKFQEIKLFLDWMGLSAPIVGNVYVLNKTVARMFNQNRIPGCVVSDELYALVEKYAAGPDKGRSFFTELAAKQLAVFKGMGFAAGYLGGVHKAETFAKIIDLAESYAPDDWKVFAREIQFPQEEEFYLFERDQETGLGNPAQVDRNYLQSLNKPSTASDVNANYRLSRLVHKTAFNPGKGLFPTLQKVYGRLEQGKHRLTLNTLHHIEHASKSVMYGCHDCGDCSLPEIGYLCPRASCSKNQRNGPCGGSYDGRCELDDKDCIWARAYDRTKSYGESQQLIGGPAVFPNPALGETSAWANNFLGRDHVQVAVANGKSADGKPA